MTARNFLRYRLAAVMLIHAALTLAAWFGAWYLRLDETLWDLPDGAVLED